MFILYTSSLKQISQYYGINETTGEYKLFDISIELVAEGPFVQSWFAAIYHNSKCVVYRMHKVNLIFQNYLSEISAYLTFASSRSRYRNNKVLLEIGDRQIILYSNLQNFVSV